MVVFVMVTLPPPRHAAARGSTRRRRRWRSCVRDGHHAAAADTFTPHAAAANAAFGPTAEALAIVFARVRLPLSVHAAARACPDGGGVGDGGVDEDDAAILHVHPAAPASDDATQPTTRLLISVTLLCDTYRPPPSP